jgi:hypothetical protein
MTIHSGEYRNFTNIQISWWFFAGWYLVNVILVAVLFKDPRAADLEAHEPEAMKQVERHSSPAQDDEEGESADIITEAPKTRPRAMTRASTLTTQDGKPHLVRVPSLV